MLETYLIEYDDVANSCPSVQPSHHINADYDFLQCVEHYTSRNLSYAEDILNAFAGFSNVLQGQLLTRICYGMSIHFLLQSLLWCPAELMEGREGVDNVPSWSWAAWQGNVRYDGLLHKPRELARSGALKNQRTASSVVGYLVYFHLMEETGDLCKLPVEVRWFADEIDENNLGLNADLSDVCPFYRTYCPARLDATMRWKMCPHNSWEMRAHQDLDREKVAIARQYLGSLVFNTTVATLRLTRKYTATSDEGPIEVVSILNKENGVAGKLVQMRKSWVEEWLDISTPHKIVRFRCWNRSTGPLAGLRGGQIEIALPVERHGRMHTGFE
jgi:hypothetical protein